MKFTLDQAWDEAFPYSSLPLSYCTRFWVTYKVRFARQRCGNKWEIRPSVVAEPIELRHNTYNYNHHDKIFLKLTTIKLVVVMIAVNLWIPQKL